MAGGVACDLEGCAAEVCQVVLVRLVLSYRCFTILCTSEVYPASLRRGVVPFQLKSIQHVKTLLA